MNRLALSFTNRLRHGVGSVVALLDHYPKITALLVGLALPLAFAPVGWLPVFYLSHAIMFRLAWQHRQHLRQLAGLGWLFGFGQFFTGLYWIGHAFLVEAATFLWALPFAVTLLPAGLALFVLLAFVGWGWLYGRMVEASENDAPITALVLLAVCLVAAEWSRSSILTGFPWNLSAMALAVHLPMAQMLALIGLHGMGLLALLSAALVAAPFMTDRSGLASRMASPMALSIAWRMAGLGLALPLAAWGYGWVVLSQATGEPETGPKILVVQPNIDQIEKWKPENRLANIEKVFAVTRAGLQAAPDTDIIVWPETALPALIDEGSGFGDRLRASFPPDIYLLTGAIRRSLPDPQSQAFERYNSAMLFDTQGRLFGRMDKHHLVPFGEYLPLRPVLAAIGLRQLTQQRGGYANGAPHARLQADGVPQVAPLICYEAIFPYLSAGAPRPLWLANLTNDAWFGHSWGPHQHLAQARLRAIEQGLPLVRSANTGISAIFDARGRLVDAVPLGEAGILSARLPSALPPTLYARLGDTLFWALFFALLAASFVVSRQTPAPPKN